MKSMPAKWSLGEEEIVKNLFKQEKSFEEISEAVEKHIKGLGYDIYCLRSPRAVAFRCEKLGLISKEDLEKWDKEQAKKTWRERGIGLRKIKENVFKRDNNECVSCGSKEKLEFAHIISFYNTRKNEEKEGITLCSKHHKEYDRGNNELTRLIFNKMNSYYPDYSKEYSLKIINCSVHGEHITITPEK